MIEQGHTLTVDKFQIELFHNPSELLDSERKAWLSPHLVRVVREAFRNDGVTESDALLHGVEVPMVAYVYLDSSPVGFASAALVQVSQGSVAYLEGTVLGNAAQGVGLYELLIALRLAQVAQLDARARIVATRTQSAVVAKRLRRFGFGPPGQIADQLQPAASELAAVVYEQFSDFRAPGGPHFDPTSGIFRRAYEGSMYADRPVSGDASIDDWFGSNLSAADGDAALLLSSFEPRDVRSTLAEQLQRFDQHSGFDEVLQLLAVEPAE